MLLRFLLQRGHAVYKEISKYSWSFSDLSVSSNLTGSISRSNWTLFTPSGVNPNKSKCQTQTVVSRSQLNQLCVLQQVLRSLRLYIIKQLVFSIWVGSGRIFCSLLCSLVNILPLFTTICKEWASIVYLLVELVASVWASTMHAWKLYVFLFCKTAYKMVRSISFYWDSGVSICLEVDAWVSQRSSSHPCLLWGF